MLRLLIAVLAGIAVRRAHAEGAVGQQHQFHADGIGDDLAGLGLGRERLSMWNKWRLPRFLLLPLDVHFADDGPGSFAGDVVLPNESRGGSVVLGRRLAPA